MYMIIKKNCNYSFQKAETCLLPTSTIICQKKQPRMHMYIFYHYNFRWRHVLNIGLEGFLGCLQLHSTFNPVFILVVVPCFFWSLLLFLDTLMLCYRLLHHFVIFACKFAKVSYSVLGLCLPVYHTSVVCVNDKLYKCKFIEVAVQNDTSIRQNLILNSL